jgi:preprotein translocase subunit SecG
MEPTPLLSIASLLLLLFLVLLLLLQRAKKCGSR